MAQQYRFKTPLVEAIQFNGLDDYLAIYDWMRKSGKTDLESCRFSAPLMFYSARTGTVVVEPGRWVVKNEYGEFWVHFDEQFRRYYEPVEVS